MWIKALDRNRVATVINTDSISRFRPMTESDGERGVPAVHVIFASGEDVVLLNPSFEAFCNIMFASQQEPHAPGAVATAIAAPSKRARVKREVVALARARAKPKGVDRMDPEGGIPGRQL